MGSKLLLLAALVAAGILAFVVISSLSDNPVGPGQGRAVKPDTDAEQIVAPPPLLEDEEATGGGAIVGEPATLSVLVTDEENHPIADARISTNIDKLPAGQRTTVTGKDGRATIEGLPGGKKVSVQARGEITSIPGTEVVELEAGRKAETTIILKEGGAVTGTVLGPGGAPIGIDYRVEVVASRTGRVSGFAGENQLSGLVERPVSAIEFKAEKRVFTIGGLKPGTYVIRASAVGFLGDQSEPFEVVKGSIRDGVTVTLVRGGWISGVVVRGRTGEPVAGANVSISPSSMISLGSSGVRVLRKGNGSARTDEMGRFEIVGVAPGDYTVTAGMKGLASGRAENVKVEKGRDAEGVMIQLGEGGTITGTVYGPDGQPVPNASISINRVNTGAMVFGHFGGNVKADENGVFHKEHLEPGRYKVKLATGGVTARSSVTIVMSGTMGGASEKPKEKPLGPDEVMVYEGQVTKHDLLSPQLCGIRGSLTNESGEPIKGRVRLEPIDVEEEPGTESEVRIQVPRFARANAQGEFEFRGLVPGRYAIHASGAREEVRVVPGDTVEIRIVVRPARVEGIVYGPDGNPTQGAHVRLRMVDENAERSIMGGFAFRSLARTDEQGEFVLKDVPPGRYLVSAGLRDQQGESTEFEVGPGAVRRGLRIDLVQPTKIQVTVNDREGNPVAGTAVMLQGVRSSSPGGRTDEQGKIKLVALPGTYDLMVIGPDGERIERKLTVGSTATQSLDLVLE